MKGLKIAIPALSLLPAMIMAQAINVEGKNVVFDAPPRMINGILMVPIRPLYDAMGVDMRWRMERDVIEGLHKGSKVEIWIGSTQARVNDARQDMEQAPFVWHGRTYAPLKFLAQAFGYMVSMDKGNYMLQEGKR